jgi:cell division protein FtsW
MTLTGSLRRVPPVAGAGPSWPGRVLDAAWRLVAALALAALLTLLWKNLVEAPLRFRADTVRIALEPGARLVLGRHELAAPHAAVQHLLIERLDSGRWTLRNLAPSHGADVRVKGVDQALRSHKLQAGDRIRLGSQVMEVATVQPILKLALAGTQRVWTYDGATVSEGGLHQDPRPAGQCVKARLGARMRSAWNRWAPEWMAVPAAMALGGEASCGQQVSIPGLPAGAAWVERKKGGSFVLGATHESARRICITQGNPLPLGCAAPSSTLFEAAVDLRDVERIWVGRTRLVVRLDEDRLELTPTSRVGWVTKVGDSGQAADRGAWVTTSFVGHDVWRMAAVPALLSALPPLLRDDIGWLGKVVQSPLTLPVSVALTLAVGIAVWARLRRWGMSWTGAVAMGFGVGMAVLSAAGFWLGDSLGEAWRLVLLSSGCAALVCMPVRTGWAWLATMAMAAMGLIGSLLQLHLGLQGSDTGAWLYFNKTAALLALVFWRLWAGAWWLRGLGSAKGRWQWPSMSMIDGAVAMLVLLAVAAIGLQAVAGSEEGVVGLQPVELAKFALVMLGAHALAMRVEWAHHRGWSRLRLWLRFLATTCLFVVIVALALGLLSDYSPLILILAWLVGTMVAWSIASGNMGGVAAAALAVGTALGALYWTTQPEGLAWLHHHGFYSDRFQVLLDLPRHPHSGEQVRRALDLASQGGAQGSTASAAWRVPAIQDDMLAALLIARYGYRAAALLWVLQLVYLFSIAALGWRALSEARPGDHRRNWMLRMGFFVTWGAAALLAGHLLISWGTVTAALPVMGQPMPLISAGGSILILLLAPLHFFMLALDAALQDVEQGRSAISSKKGVRSGCEVAGTKGAVPHR